MISRSSGCAPTAKTLLGVGSVDIVAFLSHCFQVGLAPVESGTKQFWSNLYQSSTLISMP
jgi:hypothetical protein